MITTAHEIGKDAYNQESVCISGIVSKIVKINTRRKTPVFRI